MAIKYQSARVGWVIPFLLSSLAFSQTVFTDVTVQTGIDYDHRGFMYGGGIACGDFNQDGFLDVYIPNGQGYQNLLFLNNRDGTFREASVSAGVADTSEGFGAVCGDLDNDGDLDIYLTNYFAENKLYLNNGNATFVDFTSVSGVGDPGPSTSGALADYNNDGYLDIYVVNRSQAVDEYPSTLYRNNGDGTFTDVTQAAQVGDLGSSLAVAFVDYDNDGYQDIYVVNEFELDGLYHNNGNGVFSNVARDLNLPPGEGMGIDVSDYDKDGDFDIYVSNLAEDFLFNNNGDGTFTEVSVQVGIFNNTMAWGVNFFDYENDGDQDLYIVNGAMRWPSTYDENNVLYRNNGNGTFTEKAASLGIADGGDGRASVCADFDRDGYPDLLFVNILRGKTTFYKNNSSGNNWITINLVGTQSNRSGIGARVEVEAGNLKQVAEVRAGSSYASMHPLELEFGLRHEQQVTSITIYWPSGIVQQLTDIPVNQILTITESPNVTSVTPPDNGPQNQPRNYAFYQNYPNPFNPETEIRFQIPEAGQVLIKIFNTIGQEIRILANGQYVPGVHQVVWDGKDSHGKPVPSGIYLYYLKVGSFSQVKKMGLIR